MSASRVRNIVENSAQKSNSARTVGVLTYFFDLSKCECC